MLGSMDSLKFSSSYDWGVMASIGLISSSKRGGYAVPGVETKLSARLSVGEFSNLVSIVDSIVNPDCRWYSSLDVVMFDLRGDGGVGVCVWPSLRSCKLQVRP